MGNLMIETVFTQPMGEKRISKDGKDLFSVTLADGQVTCRILYDFDPRPLTLAGKAYAGETVRVVLMPHRMELYGAGRLLDEEWPMGTPEVSAEELASAGFWVQEYLPPLQAQPHVIGTFADAEGWKPEENVFVGDCMPYRRGEEYHVLYLKDRHHHTSKWGMGAHQWEHISTSDFRTWNVHPTAVAIDDPDEGSICTGSHITRGGKEYLFYTIRKSGGRPAPICRSVSEDGYHFSKDKSFGFTLPERYLSGVARDPKVIRDDDGLYHMFLTTALRQEGRGCLAHFVSRDFDIWQDAGEPIYVSEDAEQPECPDYIHFGGRYYLIFSLRGKAHYRYASHPFHGWQTPKDDNIPCSSVPKGALWQDAIVFAGYSAPPGCYAGTMTFRKAVADSKGELIFL